MSNVPLFIGGRNFTVSCAKGEEAHVARLGRMIDQKVADAGLATQSEPMMLLFTAILLADDLHNASKAAATASALPADLAEKLNAIASRVENIAGLIETTLEGEAANA